MSVLLSFHILTKQDNLMEVGIHIEHPDIHYLYDCPNVALQILLEASEEGRLIAPDKIKYFEHLFELQSPTVTVTSQEYDRITWIYQGKKIAWKEKYSYKIGLEPEHEAFCEEAEALISSVELISHKNYPFWRDSYDAWLSCLQFSSLEKWQEIVATHDQDAYPVYTLRICVQEADMLAHIVEGRHWLSAAYNHECYLPFTWKPLRFNRKLLIEPVEVPVPDKLQSWWEELPHEWKQILKINLYLNYYELPFRMMENYQGHNILQLFKTQYGDQPLPEPDLKDLENMCRMKALLASNAQLTSLEPLYYLSGLVILDISENHIKDASPLKALSQLRYLNAQDVTDISPITTLHQLEYLDFDPQTQNDFDVVLNLTHLKQLSFWFMNDLLNVQSLTALPELRKIKAIGGFSPENLTLLQDLCRRGLQIDWEWDDDNGKVHRLKDF
ncbi:hypothetical protein QNI19_08325 [Cytophagaceae bacterium DM2B3-1]|uniref:Leucine-rich repeat domain-containing protein n=1 Tax=Xanthocytophaga flava TaxID=3048013 RepID=A0ABT7CGQ9_9BACT|nr:hypothetical protein [Xanthocytophaga flavus]MDJ1471081.1 hypothetical protein [Xanthocytophaga flavus]MDJ1492934.1 hypothetical protein [Xanthocytophaga flavus]